MNRSAEDTITNGSVTKVQIPAQVIIVSIINSPTNKYFANKLKFFLVFIIY